MEILRAACQLLQTFVLVLTPPHHDRAVTQALCKPKTIQDQRHAVDGLVVTILRISLIFIITVWFYLVCIMFTAYTAESFTIYYFLR